MNRHARFIGKKSSKRSTSFSLETESKQLPADPPRHQHCSLCLELYKSPRILPCFHTYCLACLEQLVAHTPGASSFKCPTCRTVVTVPDGGVGKFQVNFYVEAAMENLQIEQKSTAHICDMCESQNAITKCVDCEQFACDNCTGVHARIGATRSHTVLNLNAGQEASPLVVRERYCNTHKDERIRFFCNQCSSVLCRDCKLTSHEGHPTVELSQRCEDAKKMMLDVVEKADILVPKLKQSLKKAEAHKGDVANTKTILLSTFQKRAAQIKETVDQCLKNAEDNLISQSGSLEKEMTQTIEEMQQQIACLESLCQHVRQVATAGCDADILSLPEKMATFFGCDLSAFASKAARYYQSLSQQGGRRAQQQSYSSRVELHWQLQQQQQQQQITVPFSVFTYESWYKRVRLTQELQTTTQTRYSVRPETSDLKPVISAKIGETSVVSVKDETVKQQQRYYESYPWGRQKQQQSESEKTLSGNIEEIKDVIGRWYDPKSHKSCAEGGFYYSY